MLKLGAIGRRPSRGDQPPPADSRCYPQCKVIPGDSSREMHCDCGFTPGKCLPLSYVQQSLPTAIDVIFCEQTPLDSSLLSPAKREQTHGCTRPCFMPAEPTGKIYSPDTPVSPGRHWSFPVVNQSFLIVSQSFLVVSQPFLTVLDIL